VCERGSTSICTAKEVTYMQVIIVTYSVFKQLISIWAEYIYETYIYMSGKKIVITNNTCHV